MPEVVTYHSEKASENRSWAAYIVLPNGDYWGVMFTAPTEHEAKQKALELWEKEQHRKSVQQAYMDEPDMMTPKIVNPWSTPAPVERQHHLAGKVWMIHKETREKKRVDLTEITLYEKNGYERGGPRSK